MSPNGTRLRELVETKASELKLDSSYASWLNTRVTFHYSMVDRITSQRANDEHVPRAEPLPAKALVVEDLHRRLPDAFHSASLACLGVRVCSNAADLSSYIAAKLLIANATHTCLVYSMALAGLTGTSACVSSSRAFLELIDGIFWRDIEPTFPVEGGRRQSARDTFREWTARLQHPHFEMSTFFVAQNATQKLSRPNFFFFLQF